jgi:hypothetical protein
MPLQPEREEYLNPYLRRYWLKEGRVIVYQPIPGGDMLKVWFNAVLQGVQEWDTDKPYLEIQDMRGANANPGNQRVAMDLMRRMAYRWGRSAVLISKSPRGQIFAYFVNHVFVPFMGNIKRRVFFTMEEALEWLLEET